MRWARAIANRGCEADVSGLSYMFSSRGDLVRAALGLSLGRLPDIRVAGSQVPIGSYLIFAERAETFTAVHGTEDAAARCAWRDG